jgi:hypothetical protein
MSNPQEPEVSHGEIEPMSTGVAAAGGMTVQRVDTIIDLANRLEPLGAAMDKLQRFVLSRALTGDFVKFTGDDGSETLELVGAAAERVARDIGISFTNWRQPRRLSGEDKHGGWFEWWYQCDVEIGGRRIEAIEGHAGTRDKFFGRAYGEWKALEDIKEADIKVAARRCCMKEAVKTILGLRRLPVQDAERLGLSLDKVKTVSFTGGGGSQGAKEQAARGLVSITKVVKVTEAQKGKYLITSVHCDDKRKYDTFDAKVKPAAEKYARDGTMVCIGYDIDARFGPQLKRLSVATDADIKAAAEPPKPEGDAKPAAAAAPVELTKPDAGPGLPATLEADGIAPVVVATGGSAKGKQYDTLNEPTLKLYLTHYEAQLGSPKRSEAIAHLMGIQSALVGMGHAPKYLFATQGGGK